MRHGKEPAIKARPAFADPEKYEETTTAMPSMGEDAKNRASTAIVLSRILSPLLISLLSNCCSTIDNGNLSLAVHQTKTVTVNRTTVVKIEFVNTPFLPLVLKIDSSQKTSQNSSDSGASDEQKQQVGVNNRPLGNTIKHIVLIF